MSPFEIKPESGTIPVGQCDAEIVEAVPGTNTNSGNPNLRVVFETADGSQLADWWTLTPAAQWRWELLWTAAGLEFPVDGGTIDEKDLIGKRVGIDVIDDEYQGKTRRKIKEVFAPVGADVPIDAPEPPAVSSEDDEAVPFHHEEVMWDDRYHANR
jgi:hypothetical protein